MNLEKTLLYAILSVSMIPAVAQSDSGFYVGAGAGGASLGATIGDAGIPGLPLSFDQDDTAYKLYAGYRFDMPFFYLAAEGGYVDFGRPEIRILDRNVSLDTTGVNLFGVAGLEIGPVELFGKLGAISWDVEASAFGERLSDDGYDLGYGAGLSFGLGPVSVRGEYEVYDIDNADLSMLSVGVTYLFD